MPTPTTPHERDERVRVLRRQIALIERHLRRMRDASYTVLSDHGLQLLADEQLRLHREAEALAQMHFHHPNGATNDENEHSAGN